MTIETMPQRSSFDTKPQTIQPMEQPSIRERAGVMFSDGRERAKAHPYAAAAIAGGVAATAAAAIYGGAKLAQSYSESRAHPRAADGKFKKKS